MLSTAYFIGRTRLPTNLAVLLVNHLNHGPRGTEKILASGELTILQHNALATKVQNQQKAKYRNRNVLQKNGVLTAEEAWAKKEANNAKRKEILEKKKVTLVRITKNKIQNDLKACGVLARRSERERKKESCRSIGKGWQLYTTRHA